MKRLFIVDDDADILNVLQLWFDHLGFAVSCFDHSAALFAALEHIHPDLVLLDVNLGGEDGRTICRRLKSEFHLPCPVLLISANPGMKQNYRQSLADDFIDKPFNPKKLTKCIAGHMEADLGF